MKWIRVAIPLVAIVGGLAWILARGLNGSLVYFMTPTELLQRGTGASGEQVRVGGQVVPRSAHVLSGGVSFTITDGTNTLPVVDTGEIPPLFRQGIGVVVEGEYGADGILHATTLLVKHSGDYRPPAPGDTPTAATLVPG